MKSALFLSVASAISVALMPSAAATTPIDRRLLQYGVRTIDPWSTGRTYSDLYLSVGTSVKFVWRGTHGVARVPSGRCPSGYNGVPGVSIVAPVSAGGSWSTPSLAAGTYWYSCPVSGHCQGGQIIKIVVS